MANLFHSLKLYHHFIKTVRKNLRLVGGGTIVSAALIATNNSNNDMVVVGVKGIYRFLRSIRIGLTITLDYYFSMLGLNETSSNYQIMMNRIHRRCAERIRDGCLQNGGLYIKIGQGIVSLSHILPREYIDTLKVLQDKCLMRSTDELYQVFREDFGQSPKEIFQTFDEKPIAAASIAQVFKATTKQGETVAVKVQYNDLQQRFPKDLKTVEILCQIGAWLHPKINFTWIINDMRETLKQELDFIHEGLNGERCARDLKHFKYIHIPKVYWQYTKTRILVTEFVDGIKINDRKTLRENGFSLTDINYKLFEAFGYQIFQTGFVHADPHPGNILIRRESSNGEETQLIILDHGLYQNISEKDKFNLSCMWRAIVLKHDKNMKKYAKLLGVDDYSMLATVLTQVPLRSNNNFTLTIKLSRDEQERMQKMAAERFDEIVKCLRQMPHSLLLIIRNLNTIRAISYEHGCPVDRYTVLARIAARSAFSSDKNSRISIWSSKLWFETMLLINKLSIYWRRSILKLFHKLGLLPDINALIERTSSLNM